MRFWMNSLLILGFLLLDWLRFHDILKPEAPTPADWLTFALSLAVFYSIWEGSRHRHSPGSSL